MKKIFLVLSLLLASQAFASVEDLANKAFEVRKNAYKMPSKELEDTCLSIHDSMQDELKGKTLNERRDIRNKFHNLINQKFDALSNEEKRNFDFGACRMVMRNGARGGFGNAYNNYGGGYHHQRNYGNCGGNGGCMNNGGCGYRPHHGGHYGWHY